MAEVNDNQIEGQEPQEGKAEEELRNALAALETETAEGKPEETPVVPTVDDDKKPKVKPDEKPAEEEDDLKDLPEEKPTPDHWKEMRKRYKELKGKLKTVPATAEIPATDTGNETVNHEIANPTNPQQQKTVTTPRPTASNRKRYSV